MRTEIRIPTDQYAYVSIFLEDATPQEIKLKYDEVRAVMNNTPLPDNTFNEYLCKKIDDDLGGNGLDPNWYETLSKEQQAVIQSLKKFKKRLSYANKELK